MEDLMTDGVNQLHKRHVVSQNNEMTLGEGSAIEFCHAESTPAQKVHRLFSANLCPPLAVEEREINYGNYVLRLQFSRCQSIGQRKDPAR